MALNLSHSLTFTPSLISQSLQEAGIPHTTTPLSISTSAIIIQPEYILNFFSGEIIMEFDELNSADDFLEIIPAIHFSTQMENNNQ